MLYQIFQTTELFMNTHTVCCRRRYRQTSVLLLASERSERDTYRGNTIENRDVSLFSERAKLTLSRVQLRFQIYIYNWRASVASETLTGVTQSKIGNVCLFIYWRASVASETVLGVDNAKSGICYIYVCMYGWYVCHLNARAGNAFPKKTRLFRLDPSLF